MAIRGLKKNTKNDFFDLNSIESFCDECKYTVSGMPAVEGAYIRLFEISL